MITCLTEESFNSRMGEVNKLKLVQIQNISIDQYIVEEKSKR